MFLQQTKGIMAEVSDWKPICVASTQDSEDSRSPGPDTEPPAHKVQGDLESNYFKGAEWFVCYNPPVSYESLLIFSHYRSPDGTTVLTDSADHHIRTFILSVTPLPSSLEFD